MQIHELNTLNRRPGETDYLAIDTGFDTAKISAPDLLDPKLNRPADVGEDGQLLRSKGDGNTEWTDFGNPTDEQTAQAVSDWLDAHPEATTTVQDGSLDPVKLSDYTKDSLIHNIFIDGLVLDGYTDNTQAINDELANYTSGVFVIPYNCVCDRDSILSNLNYGVVIIDPYYRVVQGAYTAKYFKLLTAKNEPDNDSVVIVEDFHHPCIAINNEDDTAGKDRHSSLGFANGYNANGFLKFSFMISQFVTSSEKYQLLFRRIRKHDGTSVDKSTLRISETGQMGFNDGDDDYDYVFGATDRNVANTLMQIRNANGRAGFNLYDGSVRLDIFCDPSEKGVIGYAGGKQIQMADDHSVNLYACEKITWNTISGATPSPTKGRYFTVSNGSATNMTNITLDANIVTLLFANGNTTLKNGSFKLKGGADWTPTAYSTITFIKNSNLTGAWIELCRTEQ